MFFDIPFFLTALGLAFVLEGLPYFLFAERMPSMLQTLLKQPPSVLRLLGMTALLAGLGLVYLGRHLG